MIVSDLGLELTMLHHVHFVLTCWLNDPFIVLDFTNFIYTFQVDCTESGKDTCSKYGVSGYPTLKLFRNGEMSKDYDGPRESSELHVTQPKVYAIKC